MTLNITRGRIIRALKVILYGPEGIGKTSLAACFPGVVFIDTEGSTKSFDVARLPAPTSWEMLKAEVQEVLSHADEVGTLCIDTADAEATDTYTVSIGRKEFESKVYNAARTAIGKKTPLTMEAITGGTIVVNANEVEPLLGRLIDMFVLMGALTERDAAEIKTVLAELMASLEQGLPAGMEMPALEEINLSALEGEGRFALVAVMHVVGVQGRRHDPVSAPCRHHLYADRSHTDT